jgi:hypothetical protein
MSGPIVRKYGFPNFEKIFGERDLKHGSEGEAETPKPAPSPTEPPRPAQADEPAKADAGPSKV